MGTLGSRGAHPNHIELVLYRETQIPEEREKKFLSGQKLNAPKLPLLVIEVGNGNHKKTGQ